MFRHAPALITGVALVVCAAQAAADPAPITFAGQGRNAMAPAASVASQGASQLSGGDDNSYGYGQAQRRATGAVIDLRRPGARRSEPVVIEQRAPVREQEEEGAGPLQLTPIRAEQTPQSAPAADSGAEPWLERETVGPPYEAEGRWYVPTPEPGYEQTGTASWYGAQFHGRRTANGETFDQDALTAAHPTLPIPSLVQVTNLDNGREVIVRVNDRGPFSGNRLIDLSRGAARALDFEQAGQARVHVRYLGPAPRRVGADGAPAPAATRLPAAPSAQQPEEGSGRTDVVWSQAALSDGVYFVQVGAYSDPANARRVQNEIAGAGPVATDVRSTASGGELFRVRIGPLASAEDAQRAQQTLRTLGYHDSVVAAR